MTDLFHQAMNAQLDRAQQRLSRVAPPPQFSEAELIAADLEYLASQRERDARRQAETANLERAYMARRGWGL